HRAVHALRARAVLLGGGDVDQAVGRPPRVTADLVPEAPNGDPLRDVTEPHARLARAEEQRDHRVVRDDPVRADRLGGRVLDGPVPDRRQAPRLLGAVAALLAADRGGDPGLPDVPDAQPRRLAAGAAPALHGLRTNVPDLDDVRLLPPDAARPRGSGARGRLLALAGAVEGGVAAGSAGHRLREGFRLHLLLDRVPLRARPDQHQGRDAAG